MSAGETPSDEKPFEATQQKLDDARKKGDILQVNEVYGVLAMTLVLGMVYSFGSKMWHGLTEDFIRLTSEKHTSSGLNDIPARTALSNHFETLYVAFFGFFTIPVVVLVITLVGTKRVTFSLKKIAPKISNISFKSNFKKRLGKVPVISFLKNLVKCAIVCFAAGLILQGNVETFFVFPIWDPYNIDAEIARKLKALSVIALLSFAAFSLIEFGLQRSEYLNKQKMTQQEMQDQQKNDQGDAGVQSKRKAVAEGIAKNQLASEIPNATVVIVNPSHYAVALRWDEDKANAPVCLAKGKDERAQAIKTLAKEHRIPIFRDPPTARVLYANTDVGTEVQEKFFKAVAAAVYFALERQKQTKKRRSGQT